MKAMTSPVPDPDSCYDFDHVCLSFENALNCGIENPQIACAEYCKSNINTYLEVCFDHHTSAIPIQTINPRCSLGPIFYCLSRENVISCNIPNGEELCAKYCTDPNYIAVLYNSDLCLDPYCNLGPSYFCTCETMALKCGFANPREEQSIMFVH
eukprot:Awhi_evm1s3338